MGSPARAPTRRTPGGRRLGPPAWEGMACEAPCHLVQWRACSPAPSTRALSGGGRRRGRPGDRSPDWWFAARVPGPRHPTSAVAAARSKSRSAPREALSDPATGHLLAPLSRGGSGREASETAGCLAESEGKFFGAFEWTGVDGAARVVAGGTPGGEEEWLAVARYGGDSWSGLRARSMKHPGRLFWCFLRGRAQADGESANSSGSVGDKWESRPPLLRHVPRHSSSCSNILHPSSLKGRPFLPCSPSQHAGSRDPRLIAALPFATASTDCPKVRLLPRPMTYYRPVRQCGEGR